MRYTTGVKEIAASILFALLSGILVVFFFASNSEKQREHHDLSPKRSAGSRLSKAEPHRKVVPVHVDELRLTFSQSRESGPRNDSNDGSCDLLANRYPALKPGGAETIQRKRFAVVTYSDILGSKTEHYCKVRANHCAYAELESDADCIDNRNLEMCMDSIALQAFHLIHPAAWAKVSLLQYCCRHYEYVLLLDADLIVMDPAKYALRHFVNDAKAKNNDLTFTGTGVKETPINSGLMGIRCSTSSSKGIQNKSRTGEEFLRKTLEKSRSISWRVNGLWEQRTMRKLYLENQKYQDGALLVLLESATQCSPKVVNVQWTISMCIFLATRLSTKSSSYDTFVRVGPHRKLSTLFVKTYVDP